jgi:gp6-like head-tail connector protein
MTARRIVEPTLEPITLDEARAHVQIVETWQDARLEDAIRGARDHVERYCQRALLTQEWEVTLGPALVGSVSGGLALGWGQPGVTDSHGEDFTHNRIAWRSGAPWTGAAAGGWTGAGGIELPYAAPLQAIASVELDGAAVPATAYAVEHSEPARLYLADVGTRLVVRYVCGAADAAAVPPSLKDAMYVLLGTSFAYREAGGPDPVADVVTMPLAVEQRLAPYVLAALA